ncbi:MAG: M23 family metallopeptidase [Anaerolineales bacterium]
MLSGKGYFIWQIEKCASNAAELLVRAKQADLGHVLIKIADGDKIYPINDPDGSAEKMTAESIALLRQAGIDVWGWTFVYGSDPDPVSQARRLVQRMHHFGMSNAVINAEKLPGNPWSPDNAKRFMGELLEGLARAGVPQPTFALSSYRFISYRSDFPFDEFMEHCQIAMPQVYWVALNGGDPIRNLQDSFDEYIERYPTRTFLPTGAAYGEWQAFRGERFYWEAQPDQVTMFLNQAAAMDVPAVNFWSWQHAWARPTLWQAIAAHPFKGHVGTLREAEKTNTNAGGSNIIIPPTRPAAVGLPDTTADDGEAIVLVGEPGYQEGIYGGTNAELVRFTRRGFRCTWVQAEQQRSTAYAQWLPRINEDGEYLIEAWIPGINATTRRARYNIMGVVGQESTVRVELNQLAFSDEWARLGMFQLDGNHQFSGLVSLNNLVGPDSNSRTQVSFGPIRWRRIHRKGIAPGFVDGFDAPVGTAEERAGPNIWPGSWVDANPYLNRYFLGYHTGADLNLPRDADRGAPTYAIADGVVTYAGRIFNRDGSPSGFGNVVVIKHDLYRAPDGQIIEAYSRYAHVKDILVEEGDRVRRGDHLATIWNVGTRAHHLHFDISTTGVLGTNPNHWPGFRLSEVQKHYVDPEKFIQRYRPMQG